MNEALLTHVEALAREIGPRGTGTKGEEQAAHYVREQLQKLGLAASKEPRSKLRGIKRQKPKGLSGVDPYVAV